MNTDLFEIRDTCRKGLIRYLERALLLLPEMKDPMILDLGCGTGVPTLALAGRFKGTIYAVDTDENALTELNRKVKDMGLYDRVHTRLGSALDLDFPANMFDLVLAEGLLNIIGFETGMKIVDDVIKSDGFFILHDEYTTHEKKLKIMEKHHYTLVDQFVLSEEIWWDDYYRCLQRIISTLTGNDASKLFRNELNEIRMYKKDPSRFRSVYYVLKKGRSKG